MNELKNALSPYLLQHQNNPVHWQEWTPAALEEAKKRDVPIFLSIGYAACHWCHVMAEESFEDPETADYLNQHFVSIKVDREERPDLDNIYMQAVLRFTSHGGWPLTLFLFPDGRPFWGGTYFPKQAQYGLLSFKQVLNHILELWKNKRPTLELVANDVTPAIATTLIPAALNKKNEFDWETIAQRQAAIVNNIDFQFGGLQGAPKFPQTSLWEWLFCLGIYTKNQALIDGSFITAENLCEGGIYDHLGGGWMRYSTDSYWKVPHFEKMLYDNAQIIDWLVMLYRYQPQSLFATRIEETINWLNQEMLLSCGAYAASVNADSEHEEGKYYVWTWDEIEKILGPQAEFFLNDYGFVKSSNEKEKYILHRNHSRKKLMDQSQLDEIKKKLLSIRSQRVKPSIDDKVLLDWNALLIKAFIKASLTLNKPAWQKQAEEIYQTLKTLLYHDEQWYRCFRNGKYQHLALLEDMAYLLDATIDLHAISGKESYLIDAKNWLHQIEQNFLDNSNGLYFQISKKTQNLIANPQPIIDGALPAGNGMMATNLAKLYLLTGESTYLVHLEKIHALVAPLLNSNHGYQLNYLALSITWLAKGLIIKGDLNLLASHPDLMNNLPPLILWKNIKQSYFEICNARECLANVEDPTLLKPWLKI